jgi:uncharacterized repeat protein (TIGR01451 family)
MRSARWPVVLACLLMAVAFAAPASAQGGLQLDKADSPDPVVQGEVLTYTLLITNDWDSTVIMLPLTDTLPSGTTFLTANPSPDSTTGGILTWDNVLATHGPLAVGQQLAVLVAVQVDTSSSPIVNSAATNDVYDSLARRVADGSDTESTTVLPLLTFPLDLSDSPDPVAVGGLLTYTIAVTNPGPNDISSMTLEHTLPAGTVFQSATDPDWSCAPTTGTVTCTYTGTPLSPSQSESLSVVAQVTTAAGPLVSSVSGTAQDESDNSRVVTGDTESTTVSTPGAVTIALADAPDPVTVGGLLTYTIAVTNPGPSDISSMTLQHTLPAETVFQSAVGPNWSCTHLTGTVTCTYSGAPWPPSHAESLDVVVRVETSVSPLTSSVSGSAEDEFGNSLSVAGGSESTTVFAPAAIPALSGAATALLAAALLALGIHFSRR